MELFTVHREEQVLALNHHETYLSASSCYCELAQRTREEITRDILSACLGSREGLPISHVMFKVGMTYDQAKIYLTGLIEKGLIDKGIAGNFYHTTAKGQRYFEGVTSILGLLEEHIE